MPGELAATAIALWRANGAPLCSIAAETFAVGGNNRVLKLVPADGSPPLVAKQYFRGGERDRFASEWAFLRHAVELDLQTVPQPIACDAEAGLGLYQWIEGRKLVREDIGKAEVLQAAAFVRAINLAPVHGDCQRARLPIASDAGFSVSEHLSNTGRRLERLQLLSCNTSIDREAASFVRQLVSSWGEMKKRVIAGAERENLSLYCPIPDRERLLSPSDFGFHNVLRRDDGQLVFLDFEYAGWDDVAKLTADFFFQPAVPVDLDFVGVFIDALLEGQRDSNAIRRRIGLLQAIFGMRWCCIMLNPFLPDCARAGQFADPGANDGVRKRAQLAKAVRAFNRLREVQWPT
jgi:hypothetical protein